MSFMESYEPEESRMFDVPDGDHWTRIVKAENQTSRNGKRMHVLSLQVEGSNGEPYLHFIVEGDYYNLAMTRVFDAFKIPRGNFSFQQWLGKTAVGHFEHKEETFVGSDGVGRSAKRARLVYFHNGNGTLAEKPSTPEQNRAAQPASRQSAAPSGAEFPEDIPF